jgi:uncharacterized protein YndB with AHSA1/START domain
MKIHRSIVIAAAPDRIWPLLVNPQNILRWCATVRAIRHLGEQRGGVGARFHFEEKAGGRLLRLDFVVTEWIVNARVAYEMTAGNLVKGYAQRYLIETDPQGSLVTIVEDVKLPYGIVGRVAGLFRRSVSQAHLERMLIKLKLLAEVMPA